MVQVSLSKLLVVLACAGASNAFQSQRRRSRSVFAAPGLRRALVQPTIGNGNREKQGSLPLYSKKGVSEGDVTLSMQNEECYDTDYEFLLDEMAESIDLTRENAKLDSVSAYVVVSILTATSCFGTVENYVTTYKSISFWDEVLHVSSLITASVGALTGIYSTVVFSLCSIYGLTAIGMRRDDRYDDFMKNTQQYRMKGFRAFMTSLSMFMFQLVFVATSKIPPNAQIPFFIVASVLTFYFWQDWKAIVDTATPIFIPPANGETRDESSRWRRNHIGGENEAK